jgi:4-carboxymuconolactone decarboxylase
MTILPMDPAKLPAAGQALFAALSAKRKARGADFGGPYVALLNHPELARRIEDLGFFLKFEGVLPRDAYQFIVLSVARATGAAFEWHDHVQHALAAGLSQELVDSIANGQTEKLPHPYGLLQAILARTMPWQPVPDDLQAQAVAQWGAEGPVEIVVLSGFYQMFAAINEGFSIKPPASAAPAGQP